MLSGKARGKPLPLDPRLSDLHDGLSMFATRAGLAKGTSISCTWAVRAGTSSYDEPSVRVERMIERSQGHHTVWADPDTLLKRIVRVVSILDDEEEDNDGV